MPAGVPVSIVRWGAVLVRDLRVLDTGGMTAGWRLGFGAPGVAFVVRVDGDSLAEFRHVSKKVENPSREGKTLRERKEKRRTHKDRNETGPWISN